MTAPADAAVVPTPPMARRRGRRGARVVLGLVLALVALALLAPVVAAGRVIQAAGQDDRSRSDAVVVLGAAQFWGRPSPVLEARLGQAQALLDDGVAPRIVTVGGKQPGDITTEAQAGRQWLLGRGVGEGDVVAVPTGRDTLTSLRAVAALMAERGWASATLVTDPAHEARSLAMAHALGIDAHASPSRTGDGSRLTADYVVRETGGLLAFWFVERWRVDPVLD